MMDRHESQGHGPLPQMPTVPGARGGPGGGTRRPQGGRRPTEPATGRGPQRLLELLQTPVVRPRQAAQAAGPAHTNVLIIEKLCWVDSAKTSLYSVSEGEVMECPRLTKAEGSWPPWPSIYAGDSRTRPFSGFEGLVVRSCQST